MVSFEGLLDPMYRCSFATMSIEQMEQWVETWRLNNGCPNTVASKKKKKQLSLK